ncbi:hypothetical protein [Streptomyces chumphonensis]|uniref:hypothetical protein n=1 Tax=Streptomyces chumphonensis TaxID=1214925 RepID=UPI003D74B1AA
MSDQPEYTIRSTMYSRVHSHEWACEHAASVGADPRPQRCGAWGVARSAADAARAAEEHTAAHRPPA